MENYRNNGFEAQLADFETPFADATVATEHGYRRDEPETLSNAPFPTELESPFTPTFETQLYEQTSSPLAADYVQLLSELEDTEFPNTLYEMAAELEDSWNSKISNEAAMGDRFVPFATQQANEYFDGLANETERMIDRVSQQFSGNNLADNTEVDVERYFAQFETAQTYGAFTPAQEQFFGAILDKVKSVVKTGVNLAKKGISAVGKLLPINVVLDKLKGLIRPLLDKVLKFAIGKLPKNLQPHAQTFANKFLNLATGQRPQREADETPVNDSLEAIQTELDAHVANLVFSGSDAQAEEALVSYETSSDNLMRQNDYETGGLNIPTLDAARQQFINELKNLNDGESPAPAIERFLPAAIMALQPVIKMGIAIVGRQKVINFLAGLLAKLVAKYVPSNVAQPLAASIIDVGMSAIGFETFETNKPDLAYEAIANTIQETVQRMEALNEATLNDNEALTAELLNAFEAAAADNFPQQYIREEVRATSQPGLWVLSPRGGPRQLYKKFTHVFNAVLTPQITNKLHTFRGLPLANFLRDKLGLDPNRPIQARVHLYEAITGTRLSHINRFERVPGLGASQAHGGVLFHPLTVEAAAVLCKEPGLGRNFSPQQTTRRHRTMPGQRFYFLEINGARLRLAVTSGARSRPTMPGSVQPPARPGASPAPTSTPPPPRSRVANSSDIQGVINFVRSEIRINYYFSEEEARSVAEKLNRNDFLGAALSIRRSVRDVLNGVLVRNVSSKVRIVHEAMPEMYLENYVERENPLAAIGRAVGGVAVNAGRQLLTSIVEKLIEKLSELAYQAVVNYFKARAAEFKQAQAQPDDGITVKIIWINVPGMSTIRAVINAVKGNLSVGNLLDVALPNIPTPDVQISAGKHFD